MLWHILYLWTRQNLALRFGGKCIQVYQNLLLHFFDYLILLIWLHIDIYLELWRNTICWYLRYQGLSLFWTLSNSIIRCIIIEIRKMYLYRMFYLRIYIFEIFFHEISMISRNVFNYFITMSNFVISKVYISIFFLSKLKRIVSVLQVWKFILSLNDPIQAEEILALKSP